MAHHNQGATKAKASSKMSTSKLPPKKRTRTEAIFSSQAKGNQQASVSSPAENLAKKKPIFGLKSVKEHGKDWFKKFKPTKYIYDMPIDESVLKGKNFSIW